jgi:uncharacterized membrane protein
MSFLNPIGLSLLAFVPVIVLFYLFRARPREVFVATFRFWNSNRREQTRTSFFARRVRLNPLLILQLLAVILLSLAVAQTTLTSVVQGWPRTILIIDTSASMTASDVPGRRLGAAQIEAEELVRKLKPGQEVMVLEAAAHPSIREPFTMDRSKLQRAIGDLRPTGEVGRPDEAIRLAGEVLANGPPGEIHIFTDAAYAPPQLNVNAPPVRWHIVGRTSDNVSITALEVRAQPPGSDAYEAFITLDNFGASTKRFAVKLAIDNNLIHEEEVELPPRLSRSLVVPFQYQGPSGLLSAQIDPHDDFALDDFAYSVIPAARHIKVLLVTTGNYLLENALHSDPQIDLHLMRPEQFSTSSAKAEIVVLDSVSLPAVPPGNYLLIQGLPGNVQIHASGAIELPQVMNWDSAHPVMQNVDLSNVIVKSTLDVRPGSECSRLVESEQTPLVVACEDRATRFVFVGFDIRQSDLPIRAAFPLFVSNAIRWLEPAKLDDGPFHLHAGEPIIVDLDPGSRVAQITRPDGQVDVVLIENGRLTYTETRLAGIYLVATGNTQQRIGVDLLDRSESDLRPGRGVPVGIAPDAAAPNYTTGNELWPLLTILALIVMGAEAGFFLYLHPGETFAIILRCFALSLLAIALIKPSVSIPAKAISVAFLVDMSDSVPIEEKRRAFDAVIAAARRQGKYDTVKLITFGGKPFVSNLSEKISTDEITLLSRQSEGSATDIGEAIRLGLAILRPDASRRILLISDGNENHGSAAEAAWEAKRQHVPIYTLAIGGRPAGEVLISKITVPPTARVGETVSVRVSMWSAGATEGRLSISKDGRDVVSQQIALRPGNNQFVYKDSPDKDGLHVYSAEIRAPGDRFEENNKALAAVPVSGRAHVLLVDSDPDRSMDLIGALQTQHFIVKSIAPRELPNSIKDLREYDAVILSDVPASSLPNEEMAKIDAYVSEGGGLIMLGGDKSFGAGGYRDTPIEALLPVEMEPRAKINVPSQAIVMVIDRSGSMSTTQGQFSRIDLAKNAANLAIALLSEETKIGVLAFDTEADWIVPLQPAKNKKEIGKKIDTIETGGGGTELLSALEEAYGALKNQEAMLKHVIVLSDGEAPTKGFRELMEKMGSDKITVSTIAISSEAGQDLLKNISSWGGGRYYFTNDVYEIPRIFTNETRIASTNYLIEETFQPVPRRRFHEILKNFDLAKFPPLHGYVATTAKPFAEVLLESGRQDPILAVWRNGIGRTAAFTSDVKGLWGQELLAWDDFNKFFGQLVRWTTRNRYNIPKISFKDSQGQVSLEMSDTPGGYINFLQGQMGIVQPDGSRSVLPLTQSAPGHYSGTFGAGAEGVYLVGISLKTPEGRSLPSVIGTGVVAEAPEYRALTINEPLLRHLAKISGGELLRDPPDVFRVKTAIFTSIVIWHWLLLLSVVLMVLALMVRWLRANSHSFPPSFQQAGFSSGG